MTATMRVKVRSVGESDGLAVLKGMFMVLLLLFWEDSEAKVVVDDDDDGGFGGWGSKAVWVVFTSGFA